MPTPLGSSLPPSTPSVIQTALNQFNTFANLAQNAVKGATSNTIPTYVAPSPPIGQPLATYNPVQSYLSSQGYIPPQPQQPVYNPFSQYNNVLTTTGLPPINVNVQPTPVNINIPDFTSTFLNQTLPQLIHTYLPGAVPALNVAQNVANLLEPGLSATLKPFTDSVAPLLKNFATNFDALKQTLDKVMSQSGLNATTQWQQYIDYSKTALQQVMTLANQNAATFNEPLTKAIKDIQTNASMQTYINQAILNKLQEQKSAQEQQQSQDLFTIAGNILAWIADRIHNLTQIAQSIVAWIGDVISKVIHVIRDYIAAPVEQLFKNYSNVFNSLLAGDIPNLSDLLSKLRNAGASSELLYSAINLLSIVAIVHSLLSANQVPIARRFEQLSNAEHPTALLSPDTYIQYLFKTPNQQKWIYEQLHKVGLSDEQISVFATAITPNLPPSQVVTAELRGYIKGETSERLLSNSGLDDENKKIVRQLAQILPPVQDLISMLVHDVFSPDDRSRYQLDAGYPEQFTELAHALGLSEYWARNYWASHWQYPSPQMVMEMFHRRNYAPELSGFSERDVDDFLRLADYAPIWRPRIRAISYNTLGRIDIRRMYKAGGKDDNWLIRHYEAEGYNPTDVADLVRWTKDTQLPEDENDISRLNDKVESTVQNRYIAGAITAPEAQNILRYLRRSETYIARAIPLWDLIRQISGMENEQDILSNKIKSAVISARKRGNISNIVAKRMLVSTGMSEVQADNNLHYAELEYQIALKAKAQDVYQRQLALHNISDDDFRKALAGYEFTPDEIGKAYLEAKLMQQDKTKKPSEKDIEKWYKDGVLSDEQLQDELRGLGYTEKYVQYKYADLKLQ